MSAINGLAILLIYQIVGELGVYWLAIPIPGPVLGMLLLFLTLIIRKSTPASLDKTANFLISHLSLLFVPAGVGLMVHFDLIASEWLPIAVTVILTTVFSIIFSVLLMLISKKLFR